MSRLQNINITGFISTDNTTSTPLGIGGVFTGTWEDITNIAMIYVSMTADQASATDGLTIQFSPDQSTVISEDSYTVAANAKKTFSFQPAAQYFRVVYTNGAVAQTTFSLQTSLKQTAGKPSSHRIQDAIVDDDDAELVKSVLTGKAGNSFLNVAATVDGNLAIADQSNGFAIAQGLVTGKSEYHKFGEAPDFDATDGEVTIWDGAEDGTTWELMNYVYSTTADIDSLSSSNAADTQDITIEGLDANFDEVIQTVALNGQTRVALSTSLIRVFRAYNGNSTDLAGHVFIYVNGALTGGVPNTKADIRAIINPNNQQTQMSLYTVPAGKTAYIFDWRAATAGSSKNSNYRIKLRARLFGKIFRVKHIVSISDNGSSAYDHKYSIPESYPEKTDIEMTAEMLAAGATAAAVSSCFDMILVDD